MKMHPPRGQDESFALTSHYSMTAAEALEGAFYGSSEASQAAEREAHRLADRWLNWMRDEGYGTPASCRLDFLVAVKPGARGAIPEVEVSTVEICESGGSFCNIAILPRTMATMNACVEPSGPDQKFPEGFPKALPAFVHEAPPAAPAAPYGGGQNQWQNSGGQGGGGWNNNNNNKGGQRGGPGGRQAQQRGNYNKTPSNGILARWGLDSKSGSRIFTIALAFLTWLWMRRRQR